jgi:hypothetical protein
MKTMKITFSEIYYASTQSSILSGTDGFGVRTFTENLPPEFIDKVKNRNLFFYDAGSKPLAGTYDLIQNPKLVEDYPKTFALFKEEIDGEKYRFFLRTIFIGRDYGWYLSPKEEGARSGNTFTHVLIFNEQDFQNHIKDNILGTSIGLFIPQNYQNNPDNKELKRLLTNDLDNPEFLSKKQLETPESINLLTSSLLLPIEESIIAVYYALQKSKKVIILQKEENIEYHLQMLLLLLPEFISRELNIVANFHEYNLDTAYEVIFLNEYYQRDIPYEDPYLQICDYQNNTFSSYEDSAFFQFIKEQLRSNSMEELKNMNEGLDGMIAHFSPNINFEKLFFSWLQLMSAKTHNYQFDANDIINEIKDYPLKEEFKSRIKDVSFESFLDALVTFNHLKVARSIKFMSDLNYQSSQLHELKHAFTGYFLSGQNATLLFKHTKEKEIVLKFLEENQICFRWEGFVVQNELDDSAMEFFITNFCLQCPKSVNEIILKSFEHRKISNRFNECLYEVVGEEHFNRFLLQNDFFINTGREVQLTLFKENTAFYLKQAYLKGNRQEHIYVIEDLYTSILKKAPFFHIYFDAIAEAVLEHPIDYENYIIIFEHFVELFKENKRNIIKENEVFDKVLDRLILNYRDEKKYREPFMEACKKMLRVLKKMSRGNYEFAIPYYERIFSYIVNVLRNSGKEEWTKIVNLELPTDDEEETIRYLSFVLANIPYHIWVKEKEQQALPVYRLIASHYEAGEGLIKKVNFQLKDFVLNHYYRQINNLVSDEKAKRELLEQFYINYIEILWALRIQKKNKKKDKNTYKTFYNPEALKKTIRHYLNKLKQEDKQVYNKVVRVFLENEKHDLNEFF